MKPYYSLRLTEDGTGRYAYLSLPDGEVVRLLRWPPDGVLLSGSEEQGRRLRQLTEAQLAEIRVLAGVWLPPL